MTKLVLFIIVVILVLGYLFTPLAGKLLEGDNPLHTLGMVTSAHAMGENKIGGLFGDCMADYASGDIYLTSDNYCGYAPASKSVEAKVVKHDNSPVIETVTDTVVIEVTVTVDTPVIDLPTEETACKNKNSEKDNNPDCDAGKGNNND
jgi:hypothetical protein